MGIKLELIIAQMKELQRYADELMEIRVRLIRHKELLNDAWVSAEIEGINDVLDGLNRQAGRIADEMYGIGHDMVRAYEELGQDGIL